MSKQFWVYLNTPNNKALVHLGDCSHCNHGRGRTDDKLEYNGQWLGPYDEATALATARRSHKKRIQWCGFCARKMGVSPDDI